MKPTDATRGIDFRRISLCDALDLALYVEEEARDRYLELADQLEAHHTAEAAEFFRRMSRVEEKHRAELETRRQALFGSLPPRVGRTMIFEVEAPEYDDARVFMTVRQALDVALRCETKAHEFFQGALGAVADPEIRALFQDLCADEERHQALVRAEMARVPPDDSGDPEHYTDPPAPM